MDCISISFQSAPLELRQKFAFLKEAADEFLKKAMDIGEISQCVLLVTCNRTEVYVRASGKHLGKLEKLLSKLSGVSLEQVRQADRRYQGKAALEHLFRVTCGMDSMVLGEDEILGQVRDAYNRASEAGCTGRELNMAFQAALSCAKRIKTETVISKSSVSVATLAANEVFRIPAEPKTVLLIGSSGQIGSTILKNLLSRENIHVIATTRSHKGLYQDGSGRVENVDYKDRYQYMDRADAIISATGSPHYTVTAGKAGEAMCTPKERLFLDVAVPADIDEKIALMAGCKLITIDDFQALACRNNEAKQQALADAQEILAEELETLSKSMLFHDYAHRLTAWKEKYGQISFEKLLYLLKDGLDSDAFAQVLKVLDD